MSRILMLSCLAIALGSYRARAADLSTPRASAKALWIAVGLGDVEKIREVLHSENDQQAQLTQAFAELLVAGKNLSDASREKFGIKGDAIARPMVDPKDLTKIDSADVKVSGATATLTLAGGTKPMTFRKTDERWRLVVTDYANAGPENLPRQLKLLQTMSTALSDAAKEIHADKYATVTAAESAIQQKLHAVMIDSYRPATAPSTAPASQAAH
jgi:hypothetical protein